MTNINNIIMPNAKELKTLGEHRKIARDLLYFHWNYKETRNVSDYDILRVALSDIKFLIFSFRSKAAIDGSLNSYNLLETKKVDYKIKNILLFQIIKLMEFSNFYQSKVIDEIFPSMIKRPDAKATVFTIAGISYLEAAFNFANEIGKGNIINLQSAWKKNRKDSHIIYLDPFKFLRETPTVNDLVIYPEPDVIIKTWFEKTITSIQNEFPEQEYSQRKITAEFNSVNTQIKYEWNESKIVSQGRSGDKPGQFQRLKEVISKSDEWKPPKNSLGAKEITNTPVQDIKKKLNMSMGNTETYRIPRSTLCDWAEKDKIKIEKDPKTHECYYPNRWLKERLCNYKPKSKK